MNSDAENINKWTNEAILDLISCVREKRNMLNDPTVTKRKTLHLVKESMNAQGYNFMDREIEKKWYMLTLTFRRNKERLMKRLKRNQNAKISWPYYRLLDEIIEEPLYDYNTGLDKINNEEVIDNFNPAEYFSNSSKVVTSGLKRKPEWLDEYLPYKEEIENIKAERINKMWKMRKDELQEHSDRHIEKLDELQDEIHTVGEGMLREMQVIQSILKNGFEEISRSLAQLVKNKNLKL